MIKVIGILTLMTLIVLFEAACHKILPDNSQPSPDILRKVQFLLYTDNDLSSNENLVTFKLSIQETLNNEILWDSVLPGLRIKDIPALTNRFVIEKNVPANDPSLLKVGFYYSIKDIGNSSYLETFEPGETFKIVNFSFQ